MELQGKKLEVVGGKSKKMKGGKRKLTEWNKHLMKVFRNMKKKNKSVKLGDAMQAAKKIPYKKKGGNTSLNTKEFEGGYEHKKMEGGDEHKKMEGGEGHVVPKDIEGGDEHKKMGGGKHLKKNLGGKTKKKRGGNKHTPDMEM